jgi:hypothetical protein
MKKRMDQSSKNFISKGCNESTLIYEYVIVSGTTYPAMARLPAFSRAIKKHINV